MPFAMYARCGNAEYRVESWRQVSEAYRATLDRLGFGARDAPPCQIFDRAGRIVAHVSYNGKVWSGAGWDQYKTPLYVPS